MPINIVTVIGANGTMGRNIAGIFAAFGGATVYMVARDLEKAEDARKLAALSVKADSVAGRLMAADYTQLEQCVAQSDLIFESVFEDPAIKQQVASRIAGAMKPTAISCTGTSGLSITRLAEQYPKALRSRFFGMHFFNPPYNLTLCELIPTAYSDMTLCSELETYLRKVLRRTVVRVKDSPAFLGNRIGFQFLNKALRTAETYQCNGGVDYIDAILGSFSGRAMAPLATADFVGLDIHKAIVDNIYGNTADFARDSFVLPGYVQGLIEEGKLGRKANGGLYKLVRHDNGTKQQFVYDIHSNSYREKIVYAFPFAEEMIVHFRIGNYAAAFESLLQNRSVEAELCLQFLLQYIVYALYATMEVGFDVHAADDVMATGFNWCPPLAVADALDSVCDVKQLLRDRLDRAVADEVDLEALLSVMEPSHYDYRPFFKAKR